MLYFFSFEAGRRCPTGPGIYAFRCSRAENLFNLLQSRVRNPYIDDSSPFGGPDRPDPVPREPALPAINRAGNILTISSVLTEGIKDILFQYFTLYT